MKNKKKTKKQLGKTRRQEIQSEKKERIQKRGKKSKYALKVERRKKITGGLPLPLAG